MNRTITTAAELEALPAGAGIIDSAGDLGLIDYDEHADRTAVRYAETEPLPLGIIAERLLPATLVHEPRGAYTAPAPVVPVVSDAASTAAKAAIFKTYGQYDSGRTERIVETVLSTALPFLGAAPSATREDVVAVLVEHSHDEGINACECQSWEEWSEEDWDERASLWAAHVADALLARFTITPRTDR